MVSHVISLVERIDAILPQTQCARCGYAGCLPYARAIASGEAGTNQCPPGGQSGADRLAAIMGGPAVPLDPRYGAEGPLELAVIEEQHCIGCTLCIQACPVDAIVGAPKQMHTVITEECTGCLLCIAPCPVDCIVMLPAPFAWDSERAGAARGRFDSRTERLRRDANRARERGRGQAVRARRERLPAEPTGMQAATHAGDETGAFLHSPEQRRLVIERALARARASRQAWIDSPADAKGE